MPPVTLHFGIDYGTSASKIVVRDDLAPGRERTEAVVVDGAVRHSSCVVLEGGELHFGRAAEERRGGRAAIVYDSVKMRVAAEAMLDASLCAAPQPVLPEGISAKQLAVLSVWQLMTASLEHAREMIRGRGKGEEEVRGTYALGIPTSFFETPYLRRTFWEVLEGARLLMQREGAASQRMDCAKARHLVSETEAHSRVADMPDDPVDLRMELRPEAEAALWWALESPAVPAGPFIKVDVGAGTTNASYFRLVHGRVPGSGWTARKDGIAFFGAASVPSGMDRIGRALIESQGLAVDGPSALRGREEAYLRGAMATSVNKAIAACYMSVREAWRVALPSISRWHSELSAWPGASAVLLGGGCALLDVRTAMARHPPRYEPPLQVLELEAPSDFTVLGRPPTREEMRFLGVAYGLANRDPVRPVSEK